MNYESQENSLSKFQKYLLLVIFITFAICLFVYKNIFFESSIILKNLGEISMDPEIAFANKKPTFVEFYAEWCEVCKEMAPKISNLQKDFNNEINFVFLNVDNPKWEKQINTFNVNGIPQINLFDSNAKLESTLVGIQDELQIRDSLTNLLANPSDLNDLNSKNFSELKRRESFKASPMSHS